MEYCPVPANARNEPTASRLTWAAVLAATVLVVAMKPWAILQPQHWAEDGSVHLLDNDAWGARALLMPYRGYLHTLPRLIAWLAGRTVDVAYWPAFYNGAALLVAFVLFARMASPRLDLPGKPWLILAFVLVANAGETFLNITNLHWLTSFFLLQQVLIAPARSWRQMVVDFVLLGLVGLTGPFVVVFLPLFVWRWWRDRDRYSLAVMLAAAACAAVQGYLVATTGPRFEAQAQSLHPGVLGHMLGLRLVAWPLLGPRLALLLPGPVVGLLAAGVFAWLALGALRPGPQRGLRMQILVAFFLITTACVYRLRPDTWVYLELENGDSYFFVPRLLLVWLVIWNFAGMPSRFAWIVRGLCLAGVLLNLGDFVKPAPPNYHWLEYCGPIRSGKPAEIEIIPQGWILHYPGRPIYGEFGAGWHAEESDGRKVWRWSSGPATVRIVARIPGPARVRFALRALRTQRVTVRLRGAVLWSGIVDRDQQAVSFRLHALPMGFHDLELSSDLPAEVEATVTARTLGFALFRLAVD